MANKSVEILEVMDNNITSLGCEFLGRVLKKEIESPITTLKLDHNPIGTAGVNMLGQGLAMNPNIKLISLNYCEIDKEGAKALMQILVYIKSNLKELYLRGNNLENDGVKEIISAVQISKNLTKLDLADNKVKELLPEGEVATQIAAAVTFEKCPVRSYDFSYNFFDDKVVELLVKKIEDGGVVSDFKLTVKMEDAFRASFIKMLAANKKKAKKGKSKGKKGKKGKAKG